MADPISWTTIGIGLLAGGAAAGAAALTNKDKGGDTVTEKEVEKAPDPTIPAQSPSRSKPESKGMQSTFLSGVAGSALPGSRSAGTGGSNTGKTLIGQ